MDDSSSAETLSSHSSSSVDDVIELNFAAQTPDVSTETLEKQLETETSITSLFGRHEAFMEQNDFHMMSLHRDLHVKFLRKGLFGKNGVHPGYHSSQAWIVYWCLQGLALLDALPTNEENSRLLDYLRRCKNNDGAFGGGPMQMSHLAPTYAAVLAIAIIGTEEAYALIDRDRLHEFLCRMKAEDGSFRMHDGGEVDVRASYIAMVCATLCNILTDKLKENVANFVASCQSYEGGFGAIPYAEAHGGYTYCGLAALMLLNESSRADLATLAHWVIQRQLSVEGGFQGRTNKLVDGCYSFWQGGLFPLLDMALVNPDMYGKNPTGDVLEAWDESEGSWLMNQEALQRYIFLAAQDPKGGLRDKPSARPDHYHTCYVLSGLSLAQHNAAYSIQPLLNMHLPLQIEQANILKTNDPIYNIPPQSALAMKAHFANASLPQ